MLLVACTQHEQVQAHPLDVKLVADVDVVEVRESRRLSLLEVEENRSYRLLQFPIVAEPEATRRLLATWTATSSLQEPGCLWYGTKDHVLA